MEYNSFFNWLKTLSIQDVVLFGGILLFFVVASMGYGSNYNFSSNAKTVKVRFGSLEKNKMPKNIAYSYELKLFDSPLKYIIKADYANCLDFELFKNIVKKGDTISLSSESNNETLIIAIKKADTLLMDVDCVHTRTDHISTYIPMFIALAIILLWWMRRKIKQDRITP